MNGKTWRVIAILAVILTFAFSASPGLGRGGPESPGRPADPGLEHASQVADAHAEIFFSQEAVVAVAVTRTAGGQPAILVLTETEGVEGIPNQVDGVTVVVKVSGKLIALTDISTTARWPRPVPIGVSTGHPDITAGTIGARLIDVTTGAVYALSNNHVYADENQAIIGDDVLQPGAFDGGGAGDAIGELFDFDPITFTGRFGNRMDAAIALSSRELLGTATPHEVGYGTPKSDIVSATVGQSVQKFGRTTSLTSGMITAINARVRVGYSTGIAGYKNQIIVENPATRFIGGGDSGSLLVTDGRNPVGLLFAGNSSGTFAVANRIDFVLDRFNLSIDDGTPVDISPTVAITNPANGDTVSAVVDVTADASPDSSITKVEFFVGGVSIGVDIAAPYSASWDTTAVDDNSDPLYPDGNYTVTATATDDAEQTANDSITVTVDNVQDPTPPGVTVTSVVPDSGNPGERKTVEVRGSGFQAGATVDFGEKITVQGVTIVSSARLDVRIRIHNRASSGLRDVTVTNLDGSLDVLPDGFRVN